jgi:hypothetical protein
MEVVVEVLGATLMVTVSLVVHLVQEALLEGQGVAHISRDLQHPYRPHLPLPLP